MRGRPVSLHAMRGISAHSNGFQTCRALHLLQMLLGTIDAPGGWRYKSPHPKPCPLRARNQRVNPTIHPRKAAAGCAARLPVLARGSDHRWRRPTRSVHKAFSWDAPIAAHGMMHMVIANAWKGDPYKKIDTLLYVYGQHGLELGDEHR